LKNARLIAVILVAVVVLAGIVSIVYSPRNETSKSSSITRSQSYDNSSNAEILLFVERMLTFPGTSLGKVIAILPGMLPADLPFEVPVPDGSEVIGSMLFSEDKCEQVLIILDVPQKPGKIIEFYRKNLKKAGWTEPESYNKIWGFSSIQSMPQTAAFCKHEREGPSLVISVFTLDGEKPAEVRLSLCTNPQVPVCQERYEPRESTKIVLPILLAPESAEKRGGGESSSGNMQMLYTILETELSVIELETHYRNQLIETGWELKEKESRGSIAWSTWSFSDEFGIWSGRLLVSELRKKDMKYIELIIS